MANAERGFKGFKRAQVFKSEPHYKNFISSYLPSFGEKSINLSNLIFSDRDLWVN